MLIFTKFFVRFYALILLLSFVFIQNSFGGDSENIDSFRGLTFGDSCAKVLESGKMHSYNLVKSRNNQYYTFTIDGFYEGESAKFVYTCLSDDGSFVRGSTALTYGVFSEALREYSQKYEIFMSRYGKPHKKTYQNIDMIKTQDDFDRLLIKLIASYWNHKDTFVSLGLGPAKGKDSYWLVITYKSRSLSTLYTPDTPY